MRIAIDPQETVVELHQDGQSSPRPSAFRYGVAYLPHPLEPEVRAIARRKALLSRLLRHFQLETAVQITAIAANAMRQAGLTAPRAAMDAYTGQRMMGTPHAFSGFAGSGNR